MTPRKEEVPNTETAWAAGFFEGEGTAGRYSHYTHGKKYGPYPDKTLTISNTDLALLTAFYERVDRVGRIYKSLLNVSRGRGKSAVYRLTLHSNNAVKVAQKIQPFIQSVYKKNQLAAMSEWQFDSKALSLEEKRAWVAGVFEAEGCAGRYFASDKRCLERSDGLGRRRRGFWFNYMSIVQADLRKDLLEKVKEFIGFGNISVQHVAHDRNREMLQYSLYGKSATTFASFIIPYIVSNIKLEQLQFNAKWGSNN